MRTQIIERRDRICLGNRFVEGGSLGKIVNHRGDNGCHEHGVGDIFVFVPHVRGNPPRQHGRKHRRTKRYEQQNKTDVHARHSRAAGDQQQLFQPPRETVEHLKQEEDHD